MQSTRSEFGFTGLLLRKEFLYDLKEGHGEFVPCNIIGITSYTGHVLTFDCIVEDKFIYHYLPVNAFSSYENDPINLAEGNYFNCPSDVFHVDMMDCLRDCFTFNRDGSFLDRGMIHATIEWPEDNELCHLVELYSGHLVLRPSHKIILNDSGLDSPPSLPKYKKNHHEWIL